MYYFLLFLDDGTESEANDLYREILMMRRIGNHPHIVQFLGCVSQVHPICLILEFIPFGDLLTLLRKLRIEMVNMISLIYLRTVAHSFTNLLSVIKSRAYNFSFADRIIHKHWL